MRITYHPRNALTFTNRRKAKRWIKTHKQEAMSEHGVSIRRGRFTFTPGLLYVVCTKGRSYVGLIER